MRPHFNLPHTCSESSQNIHLLQIGVLSQLEALTLRMPSFENAEKFCSKNFLHHYTSSKLPNLRSLTMCTIRGFDPFDALHNFQLEARYLASKECGLILAHTVANNVKPCLACHI